MANSIKNRQIPAISVNQWLPGWDKIKFSTASHRRKPPAKFYVFSMPAVELRSLCGIVRRQTKGVVPRADDLGIQRQHDADRSGEISRFVEFGYPWSTLSEAKRKTSEFNDLRKPGWLPTAIVINILEKGFSDPAPSTDDFVTVSCDKDGCRLVLPYEKWSKNWSPKKAHPFEVIDGQHRLWAFDDSVNIGFEVPVVAFVGLDRSWQAYLFWTINIKPKRINPSLAFDLYPLLRAEDWLDRAEGHPIYRETRAQELAEALWSHEDSPWYDRINMLGEKNNPWVSQSAWIKSLMATFIRPWTARKNAVGGLFGSGLGDENEVLGWSRALQAGFLIFAWREFALAVEATTSSWAKELRKPTAASRASRQDKNPAFFGDYSLIASDQGVRGLLHALNDLCYVMAPNLKLRELKFDGQSASDPDAVSQAIKAIGKHKVSKFIREITGGLASFDWRTSATPGLDPKERLIKSVFRGSGGYKEIRTQLLAHLKTKGGELATAVSRLERLSQ